MFFELRDTKPYRIIRKLRQQVMSRPEACDFLLKNRCSDMSMSTKSSKWGRNPPEKYTLLFFIFEDQNLRLRAKPSRKYNFSRASKAPCEGETLQKKKQHLFLFTIFFKKTMYFTKPTHDFIIKSYVLPSKRRNALIAKPHLYVVCSKVYACSSR